jgi:hypothetical protein
MRLLILLIFLGVALLLLWLFGFRNSEANKMSPPTFGYCKSIDESKEKGVFEFELAATNLNLVFDTDHKLQIKHAWLEHEWVTQVYVIGGTVIEKSKYYQLILIYNIVKDLKQQDSSLYYFIGARPKGDTLVYYSCDKNDTIKVPLFRQTSPFLPSANKRIAYDSLIFVRR